MVNTYRELEYDQLDSKVKRRIGNQMAEVEASIRVSSEFLRVSSYNLDGNSYSNTFETGSFDEHKMDDYLFKLACAMVEKEWEYVKKSQK